MMRLLHNAIKSFSHSPDFLLRLDPVGHRLYVNGRMSQTFVTGFNFVPLEHFTVFGLHIFVFLLQVVLLGQRFGFGGHSILILYKINDKKCNPTNFII
jgi:hypothetical protein